MVYLFWIQNLLAISACNLCLQFLHAISACNFCMQFLLAIFACKFHLLKTTRGISFQFCSLNLILLKFLISINHVPFWWHGACINTSMVEGVVGHNRFVEFWRWGIGLKKRPCFEGDLFKGIKSSIYGSICANMGSLGPFTLKC